MSHPVLSVVFSFLNEEDNIPELLSRVTNALEPLAIDYELIFVNDASTDRSLDLLKQAATADRRIKIINMSRRFGGSECVLAGMEYASGDALVYLDADLQDPPELIPELVQKWREGADVVYTTRLSRAGEPPIKVWLTKWAYRLLRLSSTEIDLPVDSGDYKLISRRVLDHVVKLKERNPFLRGLVTWVGFKQVQVYYHREARYQGKTQNPLLGLRPWKGFIYGLTSFSHVPLYFSLFLGFIVSAGAFSYILIVVAMKFLGLTAPGWSALMVTLLFLGGTQLMVIGVLGLYLGRIHNEVKNRPNYIVESTIGFERDS